MCSHLKVAEKQNVQITKVKSSKLVEVCKSKGASLKKFSLTKLIKFRLKSLKLEIIVPLKVGENQCVN